MRIFSEVYEAFYYENFSLQGTKENLPFVSQRALGTMLDEFKDAFNT